MGGVVFATAAQAIPRTYRPVDIGPYRNQSDNHPLLLAMRTVGATETAFPEGRRWETATVNYVQPDRAVVQLTLDGLADDAVAAKRYLLEMRLRKDR
ncbi:MAG: hypothetical protein NZL92_07600 [Gloeomargarita sp. SKYG116]|nr:hypothetical protein [Gloeomargarita sp. SKYG116]MDW8401545.1 hypothetical protein [Gloeomargarita sp. SKYGB_i_bin116]